MVWTTRPMSWRTDFSRSGSPMWPRKYLETTTLVAICDQNFGISTSFCSNTTAPADQALAAGHRFSSYISVRSSELRRAEAAAPGLSLCRSPDTPESATTRSVMGIGWQDETASNPSSFLPHAEMFTMQHNLRPVDHPVKMSRKTLCP